MYVWMAQESGACPSLLQLRQMACPAEQKIIFDSVCRGEAVTERWVCVDPFDFVESFATEEATKEVEEGLEEASLTSRAVAVSTMRLQPSTGQRRMSGHRSTTES